MDFVMILIILYLLISFYLERTKHISKVNNDFKNKNFKSDFIKDVKFEKRTYNPIHNKETNPYKKKDYLLSLAEKNFFHILLLSIEGSDYYICPKVRLADVIYVHQKHNFSAYFNKIKAKHIDFLLCDFKTMSPKIAIELDDKSHLDLDVIESDTFKNLSLTDSGIKVVRFNCDFTYNIKEIREKLNLPIISS